MSKGKKARPAVGSNVARAEGVEKVTGAARYVDDLTFPDMLYGATVRSTIPHGRIVEIDRDSAFDWTGFTVVTARDIPETGRNVVAMIVDDQPLLATDRVRHQAEPILLLAHKNRARLAEALSRVRIHYAAEPATLEFATATEILHKPLRIEKGDLARGFAEAERIIEGEYATGAQEQLYIETNGVIALPEIEGDSEGLTIYGSLQCPYYVSKAMQTLFGLPQAKVRVVQTTTGGGFGGKEEYPSIIAGHAALLAKKANAPVKMIYDRHEDLIATTKRHASIIRHRTGLKADGTLTAVEIDVRLDGGAYVTLSPVVLSRACIHATGPYRCPHVRIVGRTMMTHTPPTGAFRGFGAPQSQFAAEAHMNRIAAELGIDPVELRRKNLLRVGDTTATGQLLRESVSAEAVLDRAIERHFANRPRPTRVPSHAASSSDGRARLSTARRARGTNGSARRTPTTPPKRTPLTGSGVALFFHGSGFTGGGEVKLASRAGIELTRDGVRLLVGSTEIGQGTRTMHAQIVADELGIPYDRVVTSDPDTAQVPDSGPTVASRTCMIVGGILQRAARKLKAELGEYRDFDEFKKRARKRLEGGERVIVIEQYEKPTTVDWSDETYRGDAYAAYAWGCNVADVEIDPVTFQARCTRITAVVDVGKAIHPLLVEGQIEGGTLQAVGWALYEDVVMRDGKMTNANLTNYIIPTTMDTPRIEVELMENPFSGGPFGAKGVGECPVDGPAAAIVNAIVDATGVPVTSIPVTPERLLSLLDGDARRRAREGS